MIFEMLCGTLPMETNKVMEEVFSEHLNNTTASKSSNMDASVGCFTMLQLILLLISAYFF